MHEVKKLEDSDFGDLVDIATNAYPGMRIASVEDKERFRQRLIKANHENPTIDFYGLYRDGQLLGGMRLHDFVMTMYHKQISAGGIGFVAVDIAHKKEKVARDMVTYFLDHCREKGAHMALLYPFRPDFYKRMGFGYGTKMSQYRVRPASLPRGGSKEKVHILRREDRQALLACYNRYTVSTHGMIERAAIDFDRLFDDPQTRIVGYKEGDFILGYLVFVFHRGREDNWLINDIVVRELVYETREALAGLLTFLHTQLDQVHAVVLNLQDDDFHFMLGDPRNGSDNLFWPVCHESNAQGVGLMYRVVDVRELFKLLWDHNFGGQDCRLKLTIEDSFLPENQGSTVVHFEKGWARLRDGGDFDVEVCLDISDFSSLVMGVVTFRRLVGYGLAAISDVKYIGRVDALFRAEEKPVCMTEF